MSYTVAIQAGVDRSRTEYNGAERSINSKKRRIGRIERRENEFVRLGNDVSS